MEGLRILNAEIKNFKNLSHKEIDFGGKSVMIVGANNKGKSSLIQALMTPLNSNYKPLKPVKDGEERGSIEITLGGTVKGVDKKYIVEMYFSQDNQKGRLVLLDEDGQKIPSPQSALDAIIGNISFDIDEFISLSKTRSGGFSKEGALKQIEILKSLLPKETRNELIQCDIDIKEKKDQRADLNKEIKTLSEQGKHEFSDVDIENFKTPIPIAPIQERLKNIGEASQKYASAITSLEKHKNEIDSIQKEISLFGNIEDVKHNLDAVINLEGSLINKNNQTVSTFLVHVAKFKSQLQDIISKANKIPELTESHSKIEKWLSKNEKPKADDILKELEDANDHNENCKKVAELKEKYIVLDKKKKQYEDLGSEIKNIQDRKREIFSQNPLPVKDLSFDEEQVLYKDLPFNEEQHPSSTIIGVGVKIAMSMNPNLKVIVIKDGSLLDKTTANAILKMTEKYGYQLLMEMVSWEGKDMEIKFLEKEI